ncbi:zinc dependent phospholipase C family protein [Vibrio gazogenes]|uniref:Zinc dependent phospholipase C n=1 Tax=Vibrio gazogenes DSM 21264 = NBRC 103151 TaxID=1123492 RepID=A0A1M4ZGF2_VIBGA|nr:zinc dependent phospholipase C family protein [Vibrio gazogenes]USP12413.1 zinc dependent phospholipase C family protein [Vibrio gazogenes]SHF17091.1 Zinc dependent phospholipase C [Vibrio gazogenes DSM 21264] [Vibrio gazogenes DSM 21264 = NBRC 103151]SJN53416.1 hypothetical protein BQ6471_00433 [Vibrio gazogenes]
MPGAFAHITAVNQAFMQGDVRYVLPSRMQRILLVNQRYVEMGAVSPDFPYLKITDSLQAAWADRMHYHYVGDLVRGMIAHVRRLYGEQQDRAFAWLSGFLAHVITDITIHPVIEIKVGDYDQNKQQHRECEMHQDAFIWQRMGLGDIGYVERLSRHLLHCAEIQSPNQIDHVIEVVWRESLLDTYGQRFGMPDIHGWYVAFIRVMALVEDQYRLFPLSRHVAAFLGLVYPPISAIDQQYITHLETPYGYWHYDQVFDFTVANVVHYQRLLGRSVYDHAATDWLKNWNLDTGRCEQGNLTLWSQEWPGRQKPQLTTVAHTTHFGESGLSAPVIDHTTRATHR